MALEFQPPADDASDADKRASEADKLAEWDAKVITDLMSTPQGRHWVDRHLDFCCEGRDLYLNDGDALGMAMRDGLARAGRKLRVEIETYCADLYLRMVRERRGRMARAQAAVAKREASARPSEPQSGAATIEELADEQLRAGPAEEAAAKAKPKPDPKKKV